jgi:hypothetical protein
LPFKSIDKAHGLPGAVLSERDRFVGGLHGGWLPPCAGACAWSVPDLPRLGFNSSTDREQTTVHH